MDNGFRLGIQKPSRTPDSFPVCFWNFDKGVSISCDFRIFNFKYKHITQCRNRMPARCTFKLEFIKLFCCSLNISILLLNAKLKTINSDFTYKIDFSYYDRQSFYYNELKPTDVCEKRGFVYDDVNDDFYRSCTSTLEGS